MLTFSPLYLYSPGSWNQKEISGFKVAQVAQAPTPPAVEKLKQVSRDCLEDIKQQIADEENVTQSDRKVTVKLPATEFLSKQVEGRSLDEV